MKCRPTYCAAIGIYPYSPADEDYIVSVPIFDEVKMKLGDKTSRSPKRIPALKITEITYDGRKVAGYFIQYHELAKGKRTAIQTQATDSKR